MLLAQAFLGLTSGCQLAVLLAALQKHYHSANYLCLCYFVITATPTAAFLSGWLVDGTVHQLAPCSPLLLMLTGSGPNKQIGHIHPPPIHTDSNNTSSKADLQHRTSGTHALHKLEVHRLLHPQSLYHRAPALQGGWQEQRATRKQARRS